VPVAMGRMFPDSFPIRCSHSGGYSQSHTAKGLGASGRLVRGT